MTGDLAPLADRARAWLADDPDPDTRTSSRPSSSGTSGRRRRRHRAGRRVRRDAWSSAPPGCAARSGAGPNRMNRVVVIRAAAGPRGVPARPGRRPRCRRRDRLRRPPQLRRLRPRHRRGDGRAPGCTPCVLPRPLPTPLLAFAIRELGCVAGVMVTASHNPPQDNGYKVYLGDGSQIVPPADAEIAARIDGGRRRWRDVPRGDGWDDARRRRRRRATSTTVAGLAGDGPRDLRLVYTPLHGVGGDLGAAGAATGPASPRRTSSPQQEQPDPDFPTVAFPNPEEPGAMDLAMALADEVGADLVVANDPDADRCAVAVPGAARLADAARRRGRRAARRTTCSRAGRATGTYACSIVSSSLLGKMAAAHGQPYAETLTGFKWIGRVDGPRVRLRGGARLLRRPRARAGQGRRLGAAAALRARGAAAKAEGRTPGRRARRPRPRARAARHRPALGAGHRPRRRSPPRWSGCAPRPPATLGGLAVESVDDLADG